MAVPGFQTLMLPLLRLASDGEEHEDYFEEGALGASLAAKAVGA